MKIAIILTSNLYNRNYIETGVVDFLAKNHNIQIFTTNDFTLKIENSKYIYVPKFFRFILSLLADYRTYIYRHKSSSFEYRIFRRKKTKNFSKRIRNLAFLGLSKIPFIYRIVSLLIDLILFSYNIFKIDSLKEFQLLLIPNSGFDPDAEFIVNRANFLGIRSILLIDNWDNLSSKGVIYYKPSELFVLSEQAKDHAVNIQGFRRESVKVIGTPRFEVYRNQWSKIFNFRYILFAGGSLPFDEISFISRLELFCVKNNFKVIYRPHPWRQKHDSNYFNRLNNLEFVILDPQIKGVSISSNNLEFQPELKYYNSLIRGSEFVITPLSTFILEGLLCDKNVVVVVENNVDTDHVTSPATVFSNYEHFKGIDNLPNVKLKTDTNDLDSILGLALEYNSRTSNNNELNYYIHFSNETYFENLISNI